MPYCTVSDLSRILPEKVKIGDSNIGVPSPGRAGNQGSQRSNISPAESMYYIQYATEYIDGRLKPFYVTPLRRIKSYETILMSNLSAGNNVTVSVEDAGAFISGGMVRLQDNNNMETAMIVTPPIINQTSITTTLVLDAVHSNYFTSDNARISILGYPDPMPLVTAQMAVSFILDRLWSSEQSPDVSLYGKTQRNLARGQIENILSGEVLLFGQEMTGRRFVRMSLLDKWSSPVGEVQKGAEKE